MLIQGPYHKCEKLEIPKPYTAATQKLVKHIDSKTGETASKQGKGIALMKLWIYNDGDKSLPQAESICFQVFLPKGSKERVNQCSFPWMKHQKGHRLCCFSGQQCETPSQKKKKNDTNRPEIKVVSHYFRRSLILGSYFGNLDC
uniref:Uncharacterized protein n=1 Tax=Theropithecus gelada TaxID=9565 RepID=A0A8D2G3I4_THEGE